MQGPLLLGQGAEPSLRDLRVVWQCRVGGVRTSGHKRVGENHQEPTHQGADGCPLSSWGHLPGQELQAALLVGSRGVGTGAAVRSWHLLQWRPGADEVQDEFMGILLHPGRDVPVDLWGGRETHSLRPPRGCQLGQGRGGLIEP